MKKNIKLSSNGFKNTLKYGRYLLAFAILFFLCKHLIALLQEIKIESISFNPYWLLISYVILIIQRVVRIFPWLTIYKNTTSETVSFLSSWTLLHLSELGKYLPGKIGQFVGMVALCRSLEISRDGAIASTLIHFAFKCLLGCLVGLPFLFLPVAREYLQNTFTNFLHNSIRTTLLILLIIGLCAIFLILLKERLSLKIVHFHKHISATFSIKKLLLFLVIHILLWICIGSSFFFRKKYLSYSDSSFTYIIEYIPSCLEYRFYESNYTKRIRCAGRGFKYVFNDLFTACDCHPCGITFTTMVIKFRCDLSRNCMDMLP